METPGGRTGFILEEILNITTQPSFADLSSSFTCSICHEPYLEGDLPELPLKLPCAHIFGHHCLLKWMSPLSSENMRNTCPLCRSPVLDNWFTETLARAEDSLSELRRKATEPRAIQDRLSRLQHVLTQLNDIQDGLSSSTGSRDVMGQIRTDRSRIRYEFEICNEELRNLMQWNGLSGRL